MRTFGAMETAIFGVRKNGKEFVLMKIEFSQILQKFCGFIEVKERILQQFFSGCLASGNKNDQTMISTRFELIL